MITEMNDMLGKLDRVIVSIYPADTDGKYRVTLSCKVKESEGSSIKELETLPPLSLYGTSEELDEGLGKAVAEWAGIMSSTFDNLSRIEELAKAATKAAAAKKKPAKKGETATQKKKREDMEARAAKLKKDKEEEDKKLAALALGGKERFGTDKPTEAPKAEEPPKTEPDKSDDLLAGLLAS